MTRPLQDEPLDNMLPTDAFNKGYGLIWEPPRPQGRDPVILHRRGKTLYQWDYIPSMLAVWEKVTELEHEEKIGV